MRDKVVVFMKERWSNKLIVKFQFPVNRKDPLNIPIALATERIKVKKKKEN